MNGTVMRRTMMAGLGALAALALYGLIEIGRADVLDERSLLGALTLTGSFFGALLIMAGPLPLMRAAIGAAAISLGVTLLLVLASFRYATVESLMDAPHVVLSALVLATVPMPFWIAASLGRWNDYPLLFGESWSILVRYGAAWAFAGVVWAVIFLSNALLGIVGLQVIEDLLDVEPVPWLVTGAILGLGLAVVQELQDYVSPYLILRLLRLLLPMVLVVTAVFLLALPVQGVSGLFRELSVALVMLAMAGAAVTLVTSTVDQDDEQATQSALLAGSAKGMSLLLPLLVVTGAVAIWLRVDQHGWSPSRVFAAEIAALGLGYGVFYALAIVRGAGWMARIRQANIVMALALLALSALNLTPLLSAESISAGSQLARLEDGRLDPDKVDILALEEWGRPGAAALAALRERAQAPGQEALASRLANPAAPLEEDLEPLRDEVRQILPLQPAGATATRDLFLALFDAGSLRDLLGACRRKMDDGRRGCVMVVVDLLPRSPGEEALLAMQRDADNVQFEGFVQGRQRFEPILRGPNGAWPIGAEARALLRAWQEAPPAVEPAPVNRLVGSEFMILD